AASVRAAAAGDWLPLLNPFRSPAAVPWMPPTTPLTAAPPTAPAAAVVASAVLVTTRTAPETMFMIGLLALSVGSITHNLALYTPMMKCPVTRGMRLCRRDFDRLSNFSARAQHLVE